MQMVHLFKPIQHMILRNPLGSYANSAYAQANTAPDNAADLLYMPMVLLYQQMRLF
jgi:hypothetical protein